VPPELVVVIDAYALPGGDIDPHLAWQSFAATGKRRLVYSLYNGGHWVPTVASDVLRFTRDAKTFSSDPPHHPGSRYATGPSRVGCACAHGLSTYRSPAIRPTEEHGSEPARTGSRPDRGNCPSGGVRLHPGVRDEIPRYSGAADFGAAARGRAQAKPAVRYCCARS
jgi:hypothetical protein